MESDGQQWKLIHKLDQSTIRTIYFLYKEPFYVEVRENLSEWIESRFLNSNLDSNDSKHHQEIWKLINDLGAEIKTKAIYLATQNQNSFTVHVKLSYAADLISGERPMQPLTLYQHIIQCLNMEREYLQQSFMCQDISQAQAFNQSQEMSMSMPLHEEVHSISDMMTKYDDLRIMTSTIAGLLKQIHTSQSDLVIDANRLENVEETIRLFTAGSAQHSHQDPLGVNELGNKFYDEKNQLERKISEIAKHIKSRRSALQVLQNTLFDSMKIFKTKVLYCLFNWKEEQVKTCRYVISIEHIEQWFDGLVQTLIDFHSHLEVSTTLDENYSRMPLWTAFASGNTQRLDHGYHNKITEIFEELIKYALIVDTQPEQLQKKKSKFTVIVRLLIGPSLQHQVAVKNVEAFILNEAEVHELISNNGSGIPTTFGELENSSQALKLDEAGTGHIAEFKNIQIKKYTQSKRKGNGGSILDDSYWLLFQTDFEYNGFNYNVSTFSVPVKIKTHCSQEPRCFESLIWDAADNYRKSDSVPWTQLAKILNDRFTRITKKGLTPEQMKVVEDMAFRVPGGINPINGVKLLTKAQFCRTRIPGMCFKFRNSENPKMDLTFWNWFYQIEKLTKRYLCGSKSRETGPWEDGLIVGFISREETVEILQRNGEPGTFLLSFSNSQIGAINIAWVSHDKDVRNVKAFTSKDLNHTPLAVHIMENNDLLTIYPKKDKIQSFNRYLLHPLLIVDHENRIDIFLQGADRDSDPYDASYEINELDLTMDEQKFGSGRYGVVKEGFANGQNVALKSCRKNDKTCLESLISELKLLTFIQKERVNKDHNIIRLIGNDTKELRTGELYVSLEFCELGNLAKYLWDFVNNGGTAADPPNTQVVAYLLDTNTKKSLSLRKLVLWAFQIANGMEYLASKKVIHIDLVGRSILLSDEETVKICDFGLSSKLIRNLIYVKKMSIHEFLPMQWLAPESLNKDFNQDIESKTFSTKSDLWSHGVTLFEIYSHALKEPNLASDWDSPRTSLIDGNRLSPKRYASPEMWVNTREKQLCLALRNSKVTQSFHNVMADSDADLVRAF